mgnify:CR=1 FL=1|jgi:hypothetical protein
MSFEPLQALFQPVPRRRLSRSVEQHVQESLANNPPDRTGKADLGGIIPLRLIPDEKRFAGLAMGGAPAWAVRLRKIETLTAALLDELRGDWSALAQEYRHRPEMFAVAWRHRLGLLKLGTINELVRRHNRYFPAEANLPMSPKTGDYIGWGGRDWRCLPLTVEWAEAQFPADLGTAFAATEDPA